RERERERESCGRGWRIERKGERGELWYKTTGNKKSSQDREQKKQIDTWSTQNKTLTHTQIHVCTHTHRYTQIYVCTHPPTHTHTDTLRYTYAHTHTQGRVYKRENTH